LLLLLRCLMIFFSLFFFHLLVNADIYPVSAAGCPRAPSRREHAALARGGVLQTTPPPLWMVADLLSLFLNISILF
jgi:hypothetical protein